MSIEVQGLAPLPVALNKVMASWAAESSRDPLLLFAATCLLSLVATLACAIPAWRAAGVNPMQAIRYEGTELASPSISPKPRM